MATLLREAPDSRQKPGAEQPPAERLEVEFGVPKMPCP